MNVIQKSEAIKNGLRKGFQDGSSKMAKRKCYGYTINSDGELEINPDEAKVVNWIFERYLAGDSLGKIAAGLERQGIPSPTGRPKWNREAIDKLLSNGCAIIGVNQQALVAQAVTLIQSTYDSFDTTGGDSRKTIYSAAGWVFTGQAPYSMLENHLPPEN